MCSAKLCAGFSVVGAIFMFWVFLMISLQPFFIKGLNNNNIKKCRTSAKGATIMFLVTFALSLAYVIYFSFIKKSDTDETLKLQGSKAQTLPEGMTDYTPTIPTSSFHAMGPTDSVVA